MDVTMHPTVQPKTRVRLVVGRVIKLGISTLLEEGPRVLRGN